MTTYTKAPTAIETRWMPAVLAMLSETEGQTKTDIARHVGQGTSLSAARENVWMALVRLHALGYAHRADVRLPSNVPGTHWYLTPRGAAQRGPAGGSGEEGR